MEFWFLATVASGLLSWGHFISSDIIDLIAQILFKLDWDDDAITKLNNENRIENWVLNLVILHYWHTIFLFWYCAVALLQFVLLKRYINKRDLTWSFPGASGRSRSLPHVSGNSAPWGSFHGWFMLFLWGHGHLGVPLLLPRCSVSPGTRGGAVSGGVRGDLGVTVRASPRGVPHPSSTLQLVGLLLERAGISAEPGTTPVSFNAPSDDQMSIAASEGSLSLFQGWQPGCVTPFGCGSIVWARPRDDGNAFPGCRVCQARVESSTASRSFKVGRVVSRWGSRWFSASPPRCHSSRKCMRSSQCRGMHLSLPEANLVAPPPHHPRWWSRVGVCRHPLGGAVCGHATVSNSPQLCPQLPPVSIRQA